MAVYKTKQDQRRRRHMRARQKISGSGIRPRLSVCISEKHIYAQFIDDDAMKTLAAVSTLDKKFRETGAKTNLDGAKVLGKIAAETGVAAGISAVVFDRGGFRYHGKIKAFADAVREGGLKF